jgi:hypothetical protein
MQEKGDGFGEKQQNLSSGFGGTDSAYSAGG